MRTLFTTLPIVLVGTGCGTSRPLTNNDFWSNDPCATFDYTDEPSFSFDDSAVDLSLLAGQWVVDSSDGPNLSGFTLEIGLLEWVGPWNHRRARTPDGCDGDVDQVSSLRQATGFIQLGQTDLSSFYVSLQDGDTARWYFGSSVDEALPAVDAAIEDWVAAQHPDAVLREWSYDLGGTVEGSDVFVEFHTSVWHETPDVSTSERFIASMPPADVD
jgi:hypothetical protein